MHKCIFLNELLDVSYAAELFQGFSIVIVHMTLSLSYSYGNRTTGSLKTPGHCLGRLNQHVDFPHSIQPLPLALSSIRAKTSQSVLGALG